MIGIFLPNMRNANQLSAFLGEEVIINPKVSDSKKITTVALWGHTWRSWPGRLYAQVFDLPTIRIEDGFLRSVGSPPHKKPHLSLIVDSKSIYYNATKESDLEKLIIESALNESQRKDAYSAIELIKSHYINKYNTSNIMSIWPKTDKKRVLVVDQTWRDDAIRKGYASTQTFTAMLHAAISENPDADIFIKPHPSVLSGRRWGNINLKAAKALGVKIIREQSNSLSMIENFDHLYVVTSLLGFEALLLDKKVSCFGMPFYAGWGLTDDRLTCERRNTEKTLLDVFYAAYIAYPKYINADNGKPASLLETLNYIAFGSDTKQNLAELVSKISEEKSKSATTSLRNNTKA